MAQEFRKSSVFKKYLRGGKRYLNLLPGKESNLFVCFDRQILNSSPVNMCGFAGILVADPAGTRADLGESIARMVGAIRHRGPDDYGIKSMDTVALGHARLSIIDLSPAGRQPMMTDDGRFSIVFNGEVYNYKELRNQLLTHGYSFNSQTDTEVILKGYSLWGTGVFSRLRGMFAIAIWDSRKQELILGRDRVGKKPCFYAWHQGILLFGSEIKAILAFPGFPRNPDFEAIHHYLSFQYVPAPWTAFAGIRKVPQACYMVVSQRGDVKIETYWQLPSCQEGHRRPIGQLREELLALLDESVRLRMVSDVPLGAFLSGGVDSSAVVAMMAQHSGTRVKTFCIGFDEVDYDERVYARMVAERYGTDHLELVIRPDAIGILDKLVWHYNEPFADSSAIPTYYVSEVARQAVTVVLNGDGGDENFLGYDRYRRCLRSEWVNRLPWILRRAGTRLADWIPPSLTSYRIWRFARRYLYSISEKNSRRYASSISCFFEQDKKEGYDEHLLPYLQSSSLDVLEGYFAQSDSYLGGAAWTDIHTYLPDDLLVKVDIASMAHGLEARSPFLDHKLMEWAASIPAQQKFFQGESKGILKSAMEPYLPHDVLYRPKMGFGVPIDRWFQEEMKDLAYDVLLSRSARERGLVKSRFVRTMLDEHCGNIQLHHARLWTLLMLELWFRMWIDPVDPPLVAPSDQRGTNIKTMTAN
ncbi:MAG: asparagine synthase (glutamine-hydrolyzing) [Gammaproteobacteria bacterium]